MEDPKYSQKCILLKHLRLLFQIQLFHSISRSLLHTPNWTHSHILQYTTPMFVQVQRPHLVYLLNFSSFSWTSTSRGTAISIIKVVLAIYLLPATGSLVHFLQQFQSYACTTSHSCVFQILLYFPVHYPYHLFVTTFILPLCKYLTVTTCTVYGFHTSATQSTQ